MAPTHAGVSATHEHHRMSAMLSVSCASSFMVSLPEMQAAICKQAGVGRAECARHKVHAAA